MDSAVVAAGDTVTAAERNLIRKDILTNAGQYVTATGAGNAFVVTLDDQLAVGDMLAGLPVWVKANHTITGAPTLRIDDGGGTLLAAKAMVKGLSTPLQAYDIISGEIFAVRYDGTNMQVVTGLRSPANQKILTAGETLAAGEWFYVSDGTGGRTAGRAYKADANDGTNTDSINVRGACVIAAASAGDLFVGDVGGITATQSGLTANVQYYLSDTAGAISSTPGSTIVEVGTAISATELAININQKMSHAAAGSASSSTTQNVDTTITCGFRPRLIKIKYKLNGLTSGSDVFTIGESLYHGTSAVSHVNLINQSTGNITSSTYTMSGGVTAGSAAGVYLIVTLSVLSISATGCVIRCAFTAGGGPAAKTSNFDVLLIR